MEKHINVVAALHIGLSILGFIAGIFIFVLFYFIGDLADDQEAKFVLSIIARVLTGFFILFSIPGIIAGIGLFRRKEWARILALILSVIGLLNFPLGTAVGVYSIWALVHPEVIEKFKIQTVHGAI
jgi:Ni,Fe-hydrogenase I cytochrome b subunit